MTLSKWISTCLVFLFQLAVIVFTGLHEPCFTTSRALSIEQKIPNILKRCGSFLGNSRTPEIVEFPRSKPHNRKLRGKIEWNAGKNLVRNFRKLRHTSQVFQKIPGYVFFFFIRSFGISGNSNRIFH